MLRSTVTKAGKWRLNRQSTAFSSLHETIHSHNTTSAAIPLIEHHRPRWPRLPIPKPAEQDEFNGIMAIPEIRSVPASALRFEIQATFNHGTSLYYEHMPCNPVDFRVRLFVSNSTNNQ